MFQIAIDGAPGTGKTTLGKALSESLGILHLDSGAIYRAFTLYCINSKIDISSDFDELNAFSGFNVEFRFDEIYLNKKCVSKIIRTNEISSKVKYIAGREIVRKKITKLCQEIAGKSSVVMDGRDVANNILKNADLKYFLISPISTRAKRRVKQLEELGFKVDYDEVYQEIKTRESAETTRKIDPLYKNEEAKIIDTSIYSVEEICDFVKKDLKDKALI